MKLIFPEQHKIGRDQLDPLVFDISTRLGHEGFQVYLVGGGVRDLILCNQRRMNARPKDFDLVTTAPAKKVRKLFSNCRIVGKRFPICHIFYERNRKIFEVTSFDAEGLGSIESIIQADAERRDLEVNCLYLDLNDGTIYDPFGSYAQLLSGTVRIVGDAHSKLKEDPIRILRILRFISKTPLGLVSHQAKLLGESIKWLGELGDQIRVFEEFQKVVKGNYVARFFENIFADSHLLKYFLFPEVRTSELPSPEVNSLESNSSESEKPLTGGSYESQKLAKIREFGMVLTRRFELFQQLPCGERSICLLYLIILDAILRREGRSLAELMPSTESKKSFITKMQARVRQELRQLAITKRVAEEMAEALFAMQKKGSSNKLLDSFILIAPSIESSIETASPRGSASLD